MAAASATLALEDANKKGAGDGQAQAPTDPPAAANSEAASAQKQPDAKSPPPHSSGKSGEAKDEPMPAAAEAELNKQPAGAFTFDFSNADDMDLCSGAGAVAAPVFDIQSVKQTDSVSDISILQIAGEPAPKKRRKSNEDAANANQPRLCGVCEEEPAVPKFAYCRGCKADVQSCMNSAKAEGKEEDFKRLTKTSAGLKHLISHYKSKCPSRGQGVPREAMNWVAYLSTAYTDKRVIKGSEEVYMDFPDFEIHMKSKGRSAKEAMDEWGAMEANNTEHDFKGRKDFEKRFLVAVKDYRLKEDISGSREERVEN